MRLTKAEIKKEADSFDRQTIKRVKRGFYPDLRRLKKVPWFYNNPWRDPEFVKIQIMPKINFLVRHAVKRGGKVLEIGCGTGFTSLELARNGLDVTAIDLSPYSIQVARNTLKRAARSKKFGALTYRAGDILEMNPPKQYYDSVVFYSSLHHMPDLKKIIKKAHSALKRGGYLIACEPLRDEFTVHSAGIAALLRVVLPTWETRDKKIIHTASVENWKHYVGQIHNEYTYKNEHGENEQSPFDNINASEKVMVGAIRKLFKIKTIEYGDAFIDKLIGGLRGSHAYKLAGALKMIDDELVRSGSLPPTSIRIFAVKQ
jgi:2-polyprenyl-3-methyl-5-hydroxy-6-metoxy-1,4-benzoquinol methylase